MVVRIADENARAERIPWVTLALIAVCLVCFLVPQAQRALSGEGAQVELEQAYGYWLEHPYLEPEQSVLEAAARESGSADLGAFVAGARRRGVASPPDAETLEQEQLGLVYLTRLALRGSDANPGPAHVFRRFGLTSSAKGAYTWLSHVFLHSGWIHFVLTALLLALAGPALEDRLGPAFIACLFVSSLSVAALTHVLAFPDSSAPLVGATGIASGAVGGFLARFGRERVQLRYFALRGLHPTAATREIGGWVLAPVALLTQLALSLWFMNSEVWAGNDWAANLAALGFGAALGFAVQRLKLEERFAPSALDTRARAKLDPRIKRSISARECSQHAEAIEFADAVLRERPDDVDGLQASWDAHVAAGRAGDGARSARRLVEQYARRGDLANGARIWDELVRAAQRSPVGATTLLRIVPELVVQARRDAAIAALRTAVDVATSGLTVGQASRVAELGAELDPPTALRAARFALASSELVDERRARLEQLVLSLENAGAHVEPKSTSEPTPSPAPPAAPEVEVEDLALPDDSTTYTSASELPDAAELFELEPTQIGVQIGVADPATVPESATLIYAAPPVNSAMLKVTPALPVALDFPGLRVRLEGGAPSLIEWTSIQAVGVALVSGLGPNPVVLIDLAMNWADAPVGELEVMRLRSDDFRARQLVTGADNALDALRTLLAELLARSGGVPLPDAPSAHGLPFREYASLDAYQAAVLLSET